MTDTLPVHVSKEDLHSLEVPTSVETTGSFDVNLVNHGQSLHVHLHLDERLSAIADIEAGNHYVEGDDERHIRVEVDSERIDGESVVGKLKVVTAYGAETRWIDVEVRQPAPEEERVRVDESLAQPQSEADSELSLQVLERPELAVVALAVVAVVLVVGAALLIQETLVLAGSVVLLAGVIAAGVFLLRDE